MSDTDVRLTFIVSEEAHPNADKLSIYHLDSFDEQVVGQPGLKTGRVVVVYFPPDTVLPKQVAEELGVWNYLSPVKNGSEAPVAGRVKAIKLRGEPSYGFFVTAPEGYDNIGMDMSAYYGATKWVAPVKIIEGKWLAIPEVPGFDKYTDIQNLRHHLDVFQPFHEVVVTEKLHGTSTRFGFIDGHLMAGCGKGLLRPIPENEAEAAASFYWCPVLDVGVMALLHFLVDQYTTQAGHANITLYGETVGPVQKGFPYGSPQRPTFYLFDIKANGNFFNWVVVKAFAEVYKVNIVPTYYQGPWPGIEEIRRMAEGPTLLGAGHIREGVVVKLADETIRHPKLGRMILKWKSEGFLTGKGAAEEVGEV